jgi:hypothetical protein
MPNPSTGKFNISVSGVSGKIKIEVYDIQGKSFYQKEDMAIGVQYQSEIDLTNSPKQMYFIRVINEKGTRVEKIGIQ